MRTQSEIADHYEAIKKDDVLGFRGQILLPYLDFERVKPYLKPEITADDWKPEPLVEDSVMGEMREYMAFAWGKVEDHRGISAGRSVEKMLAWLWLLGRDDLVGEVEAADFAQYGAPQLAVVCRAMSFPIPENETIQRMIRGEPCGPHGCSEGCGR